MSDFSNKCREYLKDTGENVYQFPALGRIDPEGIAELAHKINTGKTFPCDHTL